MTASEAGFVGEEAAAGDQELTRALDVAHDALGEARYRLENPIQDLPGAYDEE